MTGTLILWGHALAGLLFGALAMAEVRREHRRWPRRAFVAALGLSALWALAVAGIGVSDVATVLAEAMRNVAWLVFAALLGRRTGAGGRTLTGLCAVVVVIDSLPVLLALAEEALLEADALGGTSNALRMLAVLGSLLLLNHLDQTGGRRGDQRLILLALGVMWGGDLVTAASAFMLGEAPASLTMVRGPVMIGVAVLLAGAALRDDETAPAISRTVALRLLAVAAVVTYAGVTALLASYAASLAGGQARLAQTAVVFGATATLLTFASTPWLRAWTRVKLSKHLFRHRYDYRVEWQRFTATLGAPDEGAPLGERVVKAVADLTNSPCGLLMAVEDGVLAVHAAWNWPGAAQATVAQRFVDHLAGGRIVALDAVRAGREDQDASVPDWLLDDVEAWAVVPLIHGEALAGAILLGRPPVQHTLDWEDLDLLRVAGRQAASYLAEDRAHAALADAAQFDEFNRRFAFLMHDIKNVASQLTLVARNAERHADNPEFRTDMIATLRDSAGRMTALLARLGQHDGTRPEPVQPVDLAALAARSAGARRAQHPVAIDGGDVPLALAQPGKLEQALGHLLQNAMEASAPGTPVRMALTRWSEQVALDVIDQGCGMTSAFIRDQLFRPFASSKPSGFGIGAFEARQLIRAMGGALEVESRLSEGTRFRILLPIAPALDCAA